MDFGLAFALRPDEESLTSTGMILGTPAYMPPEMVNADRDSLGPETDVYSLGVILFELLAGRLPFTAPNTNALFYKILNSPPPSLLEVRSDLAALCMKTLAKRPEERHRSMASLVADLDASLRRSGMEDKDLSLAVEGCLSPNLSSSSSVPDTRPPTLPPWPEAARQQSPNEVLAVSIGSGVEMKFVWVPHGTFLMGSPENELERADNETRHRVTLTKGFYLGIHQVTQAQWQAVMGSNPSKFKGDDLPVEMVSWNDCQEFVKKLGEKTGKRFRLPTEAEWEYACRAGTTTPFNFGETISTDQANYDGNHTYGKGKNGVYREKTTPVGTFPANAWGLHDMHGNVWEWCLDWYGDYQKEDKKDPFDSNIGTARVLRGGSWFDYPRSCRSGRRNGIEPGRRGGYYGCRVVLCLD